MNEAQLKVIEHNDGIDFIINNFNNLDILTIQNLKEFALKRNGYFREDLKQFGIRRKLNEKQLLQIFELLEINITIIKSSKKEEDTSIGEMIIDFGKYKGDKWSNIPFNYLQWLYTQNENRFAYEEIKRRKDRPFDIENEIIKVGKYKDEKWIHLPTDYLEWILNQFEEKHEYHKYANIVLNERFKK